MQLASDYCSAGDVTELTCVCLSVVLRSILLQKLYYPVYALPSWKVSRD